MAGWKLRKDKTQAETPVADPEVTAAAEQDASAEETSPAAESSDWLTDGWQTPAEAEPFALDEFQQNEAPHHDVPDRAEGTELVQNGLPPAPDFERDTDLHFEEEPPLTLVDYTAPPEEHTDAETPAAQTPLPETPIPASVFAMPRLEPSAYGSAGEAEESNFSHTLRISREEMAAPYSASMLGDGDASDIPVVAPFVLDTPADLHADEPKYRLVLQVGRLSAPFDITKDVTIIGRPDSALHYYPDIEVDMDDAVSRRHAEVLRREDGCYLTDVGSTNGTLLNGEKLAPMEERLLVHGDRIRIGERTEIIFE